MTPTPWIKVICDNPQCPDSGEERRVYLTAADTDDRDNLTWIMPTLVCGCYFTQNYCAHLRVIETSTGVE